MRAHGTAWRSEDRSDLRAIVRSLRMPVGLLLLASALFWFGFGSLAFRVDTFQFDLVPFYCGGATVAAGADPYRLEPLRTCEHGVGAYFPKNSKAAVPAPQPPYVLAIFALISRVPFPVVFTIWPLLQLVVFFATLLGSIRLTGLDPPLVFASLVVSDLFSSALLGQLASYCILGIVLVALGLREGRAWFTIVGLALTATEPHLALPIFLATILFTKHRWIGVAVGATALALSLLAVPFPQFVEYFQNVLPAHALSEIDNQEQFSAAYFFHFAGVSEERALTLAKIEYLAIVALSLVLARATAEKLGVATYAVLPPALALIGGPFLHAHQMAAAIPAALVIVSRAPTRSAWCALALLAVPWINFSVQLAILPAVAFAIALPLLRSSLPKPAVIAAVACGVIAESAAAIYVAATKRGYPPTSYGDLRPSDLAESAWRALVTVQRHEFKDLMMVMKIPTEIALAIVCATFVSIAATNGRCVRTEGRREETIGA